MYFTMKVLIVTNAYVLNSSQKSQAQRIGEELTVLGAEVEIKKNFDLARIEKGKISCKKYDLCVFLDKDKVAARMLERSGMRLFNSAQAIEVCDDKMLTHISLSDSGINMPDCIYAPLCYNNSQQPDGHFLSEVEKFLAFPLVGKSNYGSLGAGVELIENREQLFAYEKNNILKPHFYQRFIDCGCGEDIRVIVVGGKYLCSMKRRNGNDFRSNIELGGKGENYKADKEMIALCEKVAAVLNLDYCGIDILIDKNSKRYVCEVNSNAFFAAAERVCGVNVARSYARYIVENYKNSKKIVV